VSLGGRVGRDDPARARLVLDHKRSAELVRHPRTHEPGNKVHRAAGREGQQQADRLLRIIGPALSMHGEHDGDRRERNFAHAEKV
jgi:hypothetical protein